MAFKITAADAARSWLKRYKQHIDTADNPKSRDALINNDLRLEQDMINAGFRNLMENPIINALIYTDDDDETDFVVIVLEDNTEIHVFIGEPTNG